MALTLPAVALQGEDWLDRLPVVVHQIARDPGITDRGGRANWAFLRDRVGDRERAIE